MILRELMQQQVFDLPRVPWNVEVLAESQL